MATGLLEVKLMNAEGLKDTDFLGKIDPFVVIQYNNQDCKSKVARGVVTRIYRKGSNPVWNEIFTFKVEHTEADNQHNVILKVMDKDTFSTNDSIDKLFVNVKDLVKLGMENGKAELHPNKYRVVLADNTYHGEIQVSITCTRKKRWT